MEITEKAKGLINYAAKTPLTALSFIAPNFIGFFLFTLDSVISLSTNLSLMKWDFSEHQICGFENFSKMLNDDTFWISLKNTFLYTIGVGTIDFLICL